MKLRSEIAWERDETGPGYLFDPRCGGIFALNETARVVVEGLADGLDEAALVTELVRTHRVGELAARDDVRAFLDLLLENDLLENDRVQS